MSSYNNMNRPNGFTPKTVLKPMSYKTFKWEYNPSSCSYSCDRTVIKHKYPELNAADLEDYDPDGAVISGEGEFFGSDAYNKWMELNAIFNQHGPGDFFHPVFTDVKQAILVKLEAKLEPRENYVAYSFEFWQYKEPKIMFTKLPDPPAPAKPSSGGSVWYGIIRFGCRKCQWVPKLQRALVNDGERLPVYGVDGIFMGETQAAVRAYQRKYGLQVDGEAGAETLSHMGIMYPGDPSCSRNKVMRWGGGGTPSSGRTYTVRSGDCLWAIARSYYGDGSKYTIIARANNISNPNLIYPGQTLTIP